MHCHKTIKRSGPYSCAGSTYTVHACACGAKRRTCGCHQCRMRGTNDSGWFMPKCESCGLKHPEDRACPVDRRAAP